MMQRRRQLDVENENSKSQVPDYEVPFPAPKDLSRSNVDGKNLKTGKRLDPHPRLQRLPRSEPQPQQQHRGQIGFIERKMGKKSNQNIDMKPKQKRNEVEVLSQCLRRWQKVGLSAREKEIHTFSLGQSLNINLNVKNLRNSDTSNEDQDLHFPSNSEEVALEDIVRLANNLTAEKKKEKETLARYMDRWRKTINLNIPVEERKQLLKCEKIITRFHILSCFIRWRQFSFALIKERKVSSGMGKRALSYLELAETVTVNSKLEIDEAKAQYKIVEEHAKQLRAKLETELRANVRLRNRIFSLELQRMFLVMTGTVVIPALSGILLSHYYDVHQWEVTFHAILVWVLFISFLLVSCVIILLKIRRSQQKKNKHIKKGNKKKSTELGYINTSKAKSGSLAKMQEVGNLKHRRNNSKHIDDNNQNSETTLKTNFTRTVVSKHSPITV
mmetsp:Transcript_15363/g.19021  ORF Transcript_15363/g.19021 Transcript_15363/m.19021 type:complete len:444 (+) Transcript_15363:239-1570(+)